jgi:hypothetical protein
MLKEINNFIKTNEMIKTHLNNLKSVRVISLIMALAMWIIFSFKIFYLIDKILFITELDKDGKVALGLVDRGLSVFYSSAFVAILMLLVYVLKRQSIKVEFFGIKIDISDNKNSDKDLNSTSTDPK